MKVGIMQPYLLPYIGYFQLLNAVDVFVVYDNIQYTKKGWINRNRYLLDGRDEFFTLPLKNASDFLDVRDRKIADNYNPKEILNKLQAAYKKAPYFETIFPLFKSIMTYEESNLFEFIYHSINCIADHLNIKTMLIKSSEINIDHTLRGQDKVIAICNHFNADKYINPIGGTELYSKDIFRNNNIELSFIKSKPIEYKQFKAAFVPWLSILDILMFNDTDTIKQMLLEYELV